ncbi:hypothetical protein BH10ACT3_BH10ACT3_16850 [soil metagenome]
MLRGSLSGAESTGSRRARRYAARVNQPPTTGSILTANNEWYRSSIFYEVHVRGFFDATKRRQR